MNLNLLSLLVKMFDKALEIGPLMAEAWLNKGVALLNPGEYRDALDHFNKALEIKPHYPQALSNKSLILITIGNYSKAMTVYDNALDINSKILEIIPKRLFNRIWFGKIGG